MSDERVSGEGLRVRPMRVVTPIARAATDCALERVVPSAEALDNLRDGAGRDPSGGDFVTPSELREFVYCQRSWFLARQGLLVSDEAQIAMETGVAFHEAPRQLPKKATIGAR